MASNEIEISLIVPLFNESSNISELLLRSIGTLNILKINYEVILVNDGSSDNTFQIIKEKSVVNSNIFFINLSKNFGHQNSLLAGLKNCSGKWAVLMDGDLQDPPELIVDLYNKALKGFDVVYAKRKKRKGDSFFKKTTATIFYRVLNSLSETYIPNETGDFRIISRRVINEVNKMDDNILFLRGQIAWLGFNQTPLEFKRSPRTKGETGYSLAKMIQFALNGILGFSMKPLKIVTSIGILISFISLIISFYAIHSHFIANKTITGWTSLILVITFMGGFQIMAIGILGEYLGKIFSKSLKMPAYVIADSNLENAE